MKSTADSVTDKFVGQNKLKGSMWSKIVQVSRHPVDTCCHYTWCRLSCTWFDLETPANELSDTRANQSIYVAMLSRHSEKS